jgi:ribosomal protein S27E
MGGGYGAHDIYDGYAYTQSEFSMEVIGFTWHKSAFILTGEYNCDNCYYCQHINACENCFWCIGIKNKKYCILNKQYTKEEYETLVWKIIAQMSGDKQRGEFFPVNMSTFCYNETMAQDNRPLTKEEASARWWQWQEQEFFVNIPEGMERIQWKDLPLTIEEIDDDIIHKVIICEETGKPFRIIKQELEFYRKHNIPLPTKHQDARQIEVLKKRMPKRFHIIQCNKCNQETLSVYHDNSWYNVWCESCYNKEIFW